MRRLALMLLMATLSLSAAAHRYHVALANIERDADGRLEIEHQLVTHDVEAVLTAISGEHINLDDERSNALLARWLGEQVQLLDRNGKPLPLQWVGFEANQHFIHIYQELDQAPPLQELQLEHSVLVNDFPGQVNTINLRDGERQQTVISMHGKTRHALAPVDR